MEPGRLKENVEGEYYTTEECDGCAYCASVAPDNFEFSKEQNIYFVSKQPSDPEQYEFVQEAMDDCPVEAIRRSSRTTSIDVSRQTIPQILQAN